MMILTPCRSTAIPVITVRLVIVCLSFLFRSLHMNAQSVEQWTAWGDAAFAKEEFYGASRFYAGALALEPGRMSLQWKQAEACRLSNQYPQAIDLYERVYHKDGGRTHPEALRWLGEMQLCDGRYNDAHATWNKVLQKEKDKGTVTALRARHALAGCDLAIVPVDTAFQVEHLPAPVNTTDSEFGARPGPDGTLWFTSLRGELNKEGEVQDTSNYRVALYSSRPTPQGWQEPVADPGRPEAPEQARANPMWRVNDGHLFFSIIDSDGTKHIASRLSDTSVLSLTGLDDHPDATQPWVAHVDGGSVLFFAAPGGEGGMDIWYGDLADNRVSNIRNAGQQVNTPGNEVSPSFDETSGMLWFSSDFRPGLGGYDIFRTEWRNDQRPAENMTTLNSTANDLYPVFDATTGIGWLTSNRKGSFAAKGETCCNDIYRFVSTEGPLTPDSVLADTISTAAIEPATSARTEDPKTVLLRMGEDFPLRLYFHNDEPEPRTRLTTTRQTYGATYDAYRQLFGTYRAENSDPERIDSFFRNDAEVGRTKLDQLVQALIPALDQGERITLDVRGHASPLALNDYNEALSRRRIESLRNHLYRAESGRLRTYMDSAAANGGVLRLRVLPFGEERAVAGVSDDINDLKRSVYSPEAAHERRIEVERIRLEDAVMEIGGEMTFDIGIVRQGVPQDFLLTVKNTGDREIRIMRGITSCDCVTINVPPDPVPVNGTGTATVHYSGRVRPGPLQRTINLEVEGSDVPYVLTIRGNVTE